MSKPNYGIKIIFGQMIHPPLPPAWKIIYEPLKAAVAISPEGKKYLMGDCLLYPLISIDGKESTIDVLAAIEWPK